jgi:hypothetical protein
MNSMVAAASPLKRPLLELSSPNFGTSTASGLVLPEAASLTPHRSELVFEKACWGGALYLVMAVIIENYTEYNTYVFSGGYNKNKQTSYKQCLQNPSSA